MTFWNVNTLQLQPFRPGISSKAEKGNDLIMVCMEIAAGTEDTGHAHAFDQCGLVLSGEIDMFVGEKKHLLTAGSSYFIPAGTRHGWKTFDAPVKLLDVSPAKV